MSRINDNRHNYDIWYVGVMPCKLFELFIRNFDALRTSAIQKNNDLAFDLKNQEAIRIDLYPLGNPFQGRCFIAFTGSRLDLKASNCVRVLGFSKFAHTQKTMRQ
ncbi:hypothetical protein [Sulfitobacter aestuariivivens]|uniref:Uncharacterized protein n=1 Tax=Sulfitobacter aestuariivivens TaxID=2766981 RepID=A0A927D3D6_9RHOB|nr:hypothetical protein [Sulfitobacter aestuariivivens]MBD3662597.1 hypothetical protein [Sulfitobacter aestuariivivens]